MDKANSTIVPGFHRMLHGGDYNPEQWLHRPEILDEDARLMREAGMTVASVGIFAWAALQPAEDRWDFSWLDRVFDRLHSHGVGVILATPSAARPLWLAHDPDVRRVSDNGEREQPGGRHNFCGTSPRWRHAVAEIDRRLAERYAHHPALLAWHISNEFGGAGDNGRCHCQRCVEGFQGWLRKRYADDLDALNRAWNTAFWSHTYQDWSQIRPIDRTNEGLFLAWRRWCSDLVVDVVRLEKAAIRTASSAPVTTNMHGTMDWYDHGAVMRELDFASFDCYPEIDGSERDADNVAWTSFCDGRMRGLAADRPWLLMESCPTQPQWKPRMRLKRPGMHRCLSLAHVAGGSDGINYFQWRAGSNGFEKHHGAVLMQDAPTHTRAFSEVSLLGADLARLGGITGATCPAPVAIVLDVQSEWARELSNGFNGEPSSATLAMAHHHIWHDRGIHADVVTADSDLSGYRLIILPGVALLRPGFVERIESALRAGAQIVVDALSGWYDDEAAVVAGGRPGRLAPLLGLAASEELDCLRHDESVALADPDGWLPPNAAGIGHCDLTRLAGAEVLVRYAGEFYAGHAALTRHRVGAGAAWYLGCRLAPTALSYLMRRIGDVAGIVGPLDEIPAGVVVRERVQPGWRYLFALNPRPQAAQLTIGTGWEDAIAGGAVPAILDLGPHDGRVLLRRDETIKLPADADIAAPQAVTTCSQTTAPAR